MVLTPLQCFLKWEKEAPERTFFRQPIQGQWRVFTYRDAGIEIRKIASALVDLHLPPESKVAILSKNCAHWLMTDLAVMMAGLVSVPIYPTLSAAGVNQIVTHSGAAVIFIGKLDNYASQKSGIPPDIVKICFPFYGETDGKSWEEMLDKHQPLTAFAVPKATQIATIMYSSGTTGTPKGVMLTHGAFGFVGERVKVHLGITGPEKFFSYLPLSHIAERALMEMVALASGSSVSFAESLDKFSENLQHEEPTIFGGVPRIYAKFQEGVLKKMPQKKLDLLLSIPLVGTMIRKKIRKKLGLANARVIVSGAAPTPVSLIVWFRKLGIEIRELYGMTENTAFSHGNFGKIKLGTVGQPWPEVEAKLTASGEILVRHAALMTGYFKDPEATALVFEPDGFLKTGDQGSIDDEGFLTITGRLKDQFKTDKAKFIVPAPLEMKLLANTDIEQVCVVGMGIPQPIALVVPSAAGLAKGRAQLANSLATTLSEINPGLEDYERIQKVIVLKEAWTLENGLMTPSMKVKRNEVEKMHFSRYGDWYSKEEIVIFEEE